MVAVTHKSIDNPCGSSLYAVSVTHKSIDNRANNAACQRVHLVAVTHESIDNQEPPCCS